MRYPASEKAEIIQLVEQSHLPAKRTLDKLGIPALCSIAGMSDIVRVPYPIPSRQVADYPLLDIKSWHLIINRYLTRYS